MRLHRISMAVAVAYPSSCLPYFSAFSIDNVTASQAWQSHSLPQRSLQTELRWSL